MFSHTRRLVAPEPTSATSRPGNRTGDRPAGRRATALAFVIAVLLTAAVSALTMPARPFAPTALRVGDAIPPPPLTASVSMAAASAVNLALNPAAVLAGERDDRVNILILGMAGPPNPSPYLTDTLLVASIQPSTGKVALVSVPRDLLVESPIGKYGVRVNSLYELGRLRNPNQPEAYIVSKFEQLTGLAISYWAAFDLSVVEKAVNTLNGIDVFVPEAVYDPKFPGPNYSYTTFSIPAGFQHLDGKTAAGYVRSRYSANGDFDRVKRQRAVLEAVAQKVRDLNLFWNFSTFLGLYQNLQSHIATNLTVTDGKRLYGLLKDVHGKRVYDASVSAEPTVGLLRESTYAGAAILLPKAGYENYTEIQGMFKNIFGKF